jgi:3-deoxy-D-manno-octulosonate 8-phosphate phosphatase (KDO 8-P phosphatase)
MNYSLIKYVVTDVDGVLTDGGIYTGPDGVVLKKFNVKDGAAVKILKLLNIETIILSSENDANNGKILESRAKKIGVKDCFYGMKNKDSFLIDIMNKYNIRSENLVYIGDDVNDLDAMKIATFRACPNDAVKDIKDICNIKLSLDGGKGCFRELTEHIKSHL